MRYNHEKLKELFNIRKSDLKSEDRETWDLISGLKDVLNEIGRAKIAVDHLEEGNPVSEVERIGHTYAFFCYDGKGGIPEELENIKEKIEFLSENNPYQKIQEAMKDDVERRGKYADPTMKNLAEANNLEKTIDESVKEFDSEEFDLANLASAIHTRYFISSEEKTSKRIGNAYKKAGLKVNGKLDDISSEDRLAFEKVRLNAATKILSYDLENLFLDLEDKEGVSVVLDAYRDSLEKEQDLGIIQNQQPFLEAHQTAKEIVKSEKFKKQKSLRGKPGYALCEMCYQLERAL
jgi:hypothetical protein